MTTTPTPQRPDAREQWRKVLVEIDNQNDGYSSYSQCVQSIRRIAEEQYNIPAAPAVAPASAVDSRAIDALTNHQRQLDPDGVEVGVSRQALDEVLAALPAAPAVAPTPSEFRKSRANFGACDGADAMAYALAAKPAQVGAGIVIDPPTLERCRKVYNAIASSKCDSLALKCALEELAAGRAEVGGE